MAEFIELLKEAELIDFGRNFSIERPALPGDRLLPDMKTQNIAAKYLAMADSAYLPTMATVHALDAEAEIGSRPTASVITVEKLLIMTDGDFSFLYLLRRLDNILFLLPSESYSLLYLLPWARSPKWRRPIP